MLCDYLRAVLLPAPSANGADASASGVMITLTARSDSFPQLQAARRFADLDARCADIRPVPVHRFDDAIEKPAARYGVQIEPGLVEAMIEDAPAADALPLFAFAMENLWRQYHEAKRIRQGRLRRHRPSGWPDRPRGRAGIAGYSSGRGSPGRRPGARGAGTLGRQARSYPPWPRLARRGRRFAGWRRSTASMPRHGSCWSPSINGAWWYEASRRRAVAARWRWRTKPSSAAGLDSSAGWSRQRARLEALRGLETAARVWDRHGRRRAYLDHRGRRLKAARALIRQYRFPERNRADAAGLPRRCHTRPRQTLYGSWRGHRRPCGGRCRVVVGGQLDDRKRGKSEDSIGCAGGEGWAGWLHRTGDA